ncbi:MAG TPA: phage minor head protein, partial [Anaerolineales bacterium]
IPQLTERVRAIFSRANKWRAETIARTETLEASNRAAFIAYGEAGIVPKIEWLLAPDYFPEIDNGECAPYEGKVVEHGQEFAPGVLYPPLHPRCRCTIAPVFEGPGGEERRLYQGDHRKAHITALGQEHTRLERMFLARLKKALGEQERRILRRLRAAE